jgi:hypothetical protein
MVHAKLPRFRSALRRLLGGKPQAFERSMIAVVAERAASRPGATPDTVLEDLARRRSRKLTEQQALELRLALERDMPGGAG